MQPKIFCNRLGKTQIFRKRKINRYGTKRFSLINRICKIKKKEHPIQEITASTCGIFQIYFYKKLFDPEEKSSIIKDEFLTKKTIENLINEIFSSNPEENEKEMQNYKREYNL